MAPGGYAHSCDAIGGRAGAYSFAGNVGLPLGESGFANLSLEYGGSDPTNRAVQRTDAQSLLDVGNTSVRDTAQVWGVPRVSDDVKAFANLGFQAGLYRPYLHANYARREVLGGFYYRHPYSRGGVFRGPEIDGGPSLLVGDRLLAESGGLSSAGCPGIPIVDGLPDSVALAAVEANPDCFTLFSRFPGGFTPQFGGTLFDGSTVAGVRYLRPDGFGWDLSAGVGRSRVHQLLTNSVNASLGPDTPTTFRPGMAEQTEVNVNFDVTVPLDAGFHLATGAEWRQEAFRLGAGERASWEIGPYAAQGFSSGSNGFNGYRPDTAAGRWARANVAAYADLEHRDDDGRWTLAGALRAEHFADFGVTLNGKIAGFHAVNPRSGSLVGALVQPRCERYRERGEHAADDGQPSLQVHVRYPAPLYARTFGPFRGVPGSSVPCETGLSLSPFPSGSTPSGSARAPRAACRSLLPRVRPPRRRRPVAGCSSSAGPGRRRCTSRPAIRR